MLVRCEGCQAVISDTAAKCPKCGAPSETFLGSSFPCPECGAQYRPAYSDCPSCGAPRAIALPTAVQISAPRQAIEEVQASQNIDTGSAHAVADNRPDGRENGEAVYVSLVPIRSQSGRLRWALTAYLVSLLLVTGLQLTTLWLADSVKSGSWSAPVSAEQVAGAIDSALPYLNFAVMASFLLSAVMYCQFVYRALKELAGAPAITLSPFFGVMATFIPILNLWIPYRAMNQIWRASHGFADRPASPPVNRPGNPGGSLV